MRQGKIELVVGIFTLVGFLFMGVLVFFVTDFYFIRHGRTFDVIFKYVSILDKGAPVRMSGMRVGEVKKLAIRYHAITKAPEIVMTVFVNQAVEIRERTQVTIRGTTPLSEPHIEIISQGEKDGPLVTNGAVLTGIDPIPMEKLMITANEILDAADDFMQRINKFFQDPAIATSFKNIVINLDVLVQALRKITTQQEGNLEESVAHIAKASATLEVLLNDVRNGRGTAGKLFADDGLYNEILAFVKDLKAHPWKLLAKPKKEGKKGFLIF